MAILSFKTKKYNQQFSKLPKHIQESTQKMFNEWKSGSEIKLKPIAQLGEGFYSLQLDESYRALGYKQKVLVNGQTLVYMQWYFVGTHEDYNKEYKQRKEADKKKTMFKNDIAEKIEILAKKSKIQGTVQGTISYN